MTTNDTFLTRLKDEQAVLAERLDKLTQFINTNKFDEVSPRQQQLLVLQQQTMILYNTILKQRLHDLNENL